MLIMPSRTPDTPFSAKRVVDVLDDRTNEETREIPGSIQETDLGGARVSEVLMPQRRSLQSSHKGTVVLPSDRYLLSLVRPTTVQDHSDHDSTEKADVSGRSWF